MSWSSVLKKNAHIEQPKVKEKKKIVENNNFDPYQDLYFKDIDEEFEHLYLNKMTNISIEFRDYISKNYLPFMDKHIPIKYTIYDFLKNNSEEFLKTTKKVTDYNEELIKEYDKEQEEIMKELEDEDYISD